MPHLLVHTPLRIYTYKNKGVKTNTSSRMKPPIRMRLKIPWTMLYEFCLKHHQNLETHWTEH
jgi:hypothetical protein